MPILLLSYLSLPVFSTEKEIRMVPMPLECPSKGLVVREVPILFPSANPESAFKAITSEFIPTSMFEDEGRNLNRANLAKLEVCPHATGSNKFRIGIDYKNVEDTEDNSDLLSAIYDCIKIIGENFKISTQVVLISVPLESPLFDTLNELEEKSRAEELEAKSAEDEPQ